MSAWKPVAAVAVLFLLAGSGCYSTRPSSGAGQTDFSPPRRVAASDVAVPPGYVIEAIATDLTFPTGVTFDDTGAAVVVESGYSYGEVFAEPRLVRVDSSGTQVIARGNNDGPWTGVTFYEGAFYVAAGDVKGDGKLLRIDRDGRSTALVTGLPSRGDHHTNGPVAGPDGWIYFAQGTATNSGVVGKDNADFGWLRRFPDFHDVPGQDITLAGVNYGSGNPLGADEQREVETGGFAPFGTASRAGQIVKGQVKASGSVLRVRPEGGEPELIAWGFRNPFGLAFSPEGALFVTENGYDNRGSRPVWGAPDFLWQVERGRWYGWPDFVGGEAITSEHFKPPGKPALRFLLAQHPGEPPQPKARFAVHSSADGFDFSRAEAFGYVGQAFVALFGDEAPTTGKVLAAVGCRVVRVDPSSGIIEDFAVNRGKIAGPASKIGGGGLERPVAARFSPDGGALYVVDFGVMLHDQQGAKPQAGTGVLWRIRRGDLQ
ncbi:PQQ-dependent sugar dehydrogenase [Opitutus terrae]|uniref:Glucose/sorbosone dehydrogenase-like protein n=1 Tax=Opitutus terrae (strain DSM 11246 / JCM 15787 / PB90-1) TaxID=452637 RepID=B1ZRL2_OPITP|nr:PQQ-dependent sugar dehydrogenase [Opitutus terrae]ACB77662.1 Glucose/sorbosone dehydrogenase-like protein [Opitutus terrae PB90-1]